MDFLERRKEQSSRCHWRKEAAPCPSWETSYRSPGERARPSLAPLSRELGTGAKSRLLFPASLRKLGGEVMLQVFGLWSSLRALNPRPLNSRLSRAPSLANGPQRARAQVGYAGTAWVPDCLSLWLMTCLPAPHGPFPSPPC